MPKILSMGCALTLWTGCLTALAGELDVLISEIHYNVFQEGGEDTFEFVELYNGGPTDVDIGGWYFSQGIEFTFEPGTIIRSREHLIVSPDPAAARLRFGLSRAMGPFSGRLDNGGEIVELSSRDGRVISRVHYLDSSPWPAEADGGGPSLEFSGTDSGHDVAWRWKPSRGLDGTPGASNSRREPPSPYVLVGGRRIVGATDEWALFRGLGEPASPVGAWTGRAFDDGGWERRRGGFGFGTGTGFQFTTELTDMRYNYTTVYIRRAFSLTAEVVDAVRRGEMSLHLSVSYDDGFVAYLNGAEVVRENAGTTGSPLPFDALADGSETASREYTLDGFSGSLRAGTNVLALQGLNRAIDNGDFYLGAALELVEVPAAPEEEEEVRIDGVLNEIRPSGGPGRPGFVELYNPTGASLSLGGHYLISSRDDFFILPAGSSIAPGGFLFFEDSALGFNVRSQNASYLLLQPDALTIVDFLQVEPRGDANSFGRYPDGDEDTYVMESPTPGGANSLDLEEPVVINEIYFHPPYVPPGGGCVRNCSDSRQWIELHNRSGAEVDMTGWSLTKGIDFEFPAGLRMPAGGYLVVASSVDEFRAEHPGVTAATGDFSGRLSHSSDTINLRDALGNRVDHVKYGDGQPINDEEPENGVDDRTLRSSPWPYGADGSGYSLELVHPDLENKYGGAWRVSAITGGTPAEPNTMAVASPPPVVDDVRNNPLVPNSLDTVWITCRISSVAPVTRAEVRWAVDGGGPLGTVGLRDDGLGGDEAAGDGEFTAQLSARPDGTIVRFRLRVEAGADQVTEVPLTPEVPPYAGFEGPFFLYEVDDSRPTAFSPLYRVILTAADRQELRDRPATSDVLLPATFIGGGRAYHAVGLRFRGESSRRDENRSYRIDFPSERRFEGIEHLNLNGANGRNNTDTAVDIAAADVYRCVGMAYPQEWPITIHFAGEVTLDFDARYSRKEAYDNLFLSRFFGGSDEGNLYRALNPGGPGAASGNLLYLGDDPDAYRDVYDKRSNEDADDFSDIIELTRAFDPAETPAAVFADTLDALIDAAEWARFFAVMACLNNIDGGIWNNN
ncbi:MAG: lamin tail domain-containing protein, partial [Planctomycetes bacterium]|nr:lamin tail domain-containing protein [Planctomycetota bacterium]